MLGKSGHFLMFFSVSVYIQDAKEKGRHHLSHFVSHSLFLFRLGSNKVGDLGVKLLAEILRNPDCKMQQLCLNSNMLTDSCADDLSSILSTGRSLTVVNLNDNKLGDSGVKLLPAALRNPNCKIQKLELRGNCLSEPCAEDLASILNTNQSLAELNLGNNKLKHLGVKRLSLALMNPHCKIQKLLLYRNGLTKSCVQVLSSALSKNQSLMKLNVDNNNLGDSGVKLLCAVLGNSDCLMCLPFTHSQNNLQRL
ncbi:NACHT, LRR and PYD domains-containing protein 3-like, partial [Chiloscyllium plagiosum]|uniref:NACHT, LRR and PYD domains-containing protein 3-like n=1 Tax=Chiloscyllium plagiosum TaxID=36176 RepID=UPI001CB85055